MRNKRWKGGNERGEKVPLDEPYRDHLKKRCVMASSRVSSASSRALCIYRFSVNNPLGGVPLVTHFTFPILRYFGNMETVFSFFSCVILTSKGPRDILYYNFSSSLRMTILTP